MIVLPLQAVAMDPIRAMSRTVFELNTPLHPPLADCAYAARTFGTETAREMIEEGVQIHCEVGTKLVR